MDRKRKLSATNVSVKVSTDQVLEDFTNLMRLFPDEHPACIHGIMCICNNDVSQACSLLLYVQQERQLMEKKRKKKSEVEKPQDHSLQEEIPQEEIQQDEKTQGHILDRILQQLIPEENVLPEEMHQEPIPKENMLQEPILEEKILQKEIPNELIPDEQMLQEPILKQKMLVKKMMLESIPNENILQDLIPEENILPEELLQETEQKEFPQEVKPSLLDNEPVPSTSYAQPIKMDVYDYDFIDDIKLRVRKCKKYNLADIPGSKSNSVTSPSWSPSGSSSLFRSNASSIKDEDDRMDINDTSDTLGNIWMCNHPEENYSIRNTPNTSQDSISTVTASTKINNINDTGEAMPQNMLWYTDDIIVPPAQILGVEGIAIQSDYIKITKMKT